MIVVTTPTGQIGHHVLSQLVAAGESVRAVARDRQRIASDLVDRIEVVEGSHGDPATLPRALDGAEAIFWCVPPNVQLDDVRGYYLGFIEPLVAALPKSTIRRVVVVSSGGRGRSRSGLIAVSHAGEELLETTGVPLRALRCGSFMENLLQQREPLRHQGMFFNPLGGDVAVPVVATRDIGTKAAALLRDRTWTGQEGVGVHGPADLSGNDMARVMTEVLGRPIRYQEVPGPAYKETLLAHGASEAFAQGYIEMFAEIGAGIHDADPRTPESTTPTTFATWCAEVLKPALG